MILYTAYYVVVLLLTLVSLGISTFVDNLYVADTYQTGFCFDSLTNDHIYSYDGFHTYKISLLTHESTILKGMCVFLLTS